MDIEEVVLLPGLVRDGVIFRRQLFGNNLKSLFRYRDEKQIVCIDEEKVSRKSMCYMDSE